MEREAQMYREILLHRRSKIGFCDPTTLSHPERRMFRRGQSQRSEESSSAPVVFISLFFIRVTPGLGLHSQPIIRSRDNDYLKKKKKKRRFGPLEINNATSASPPFPSTWHSSSETNKATTRNSDCFRVCG